MHQKILLVLEKEVLWDMIKKKITHEMSLLYGLKMEFLEWLA